MLTYAGVRGVAANVAYFFLLYAFFVFFTRLIMKNLFDTLSFGKFIAMGSVSALLAIVCLHFLSNYINLVLAVTGIVFSVTIPVLSINNNSLRKDLSCDITDSSKASTRI